MAYWILTAIAIISFGFGWGIGYAQGRRIGYMVGRELERRKHVDQFTQLERTQ